MNRNIFRASILISAMLAASAALAGADVVKCVDQDGRVTLTDSQCGDGAQAVPVAAAAETTEAASVDAQPEEIATVPVPPAMRRLSIERIVLAPAQMQHGSWSAPRPSGRMLARDVETLKAARLSMQVMDQASATSRHQRLAGLN